MAYRLPPPTNQLPQEIPGFLPGSSSLVEQLDKRLLLIMRDGRHLIGFMRSFDQFTNFALEDAIERRFYTDVSTNTTYYSDVSLGGVFLVRGDSVVVLGEITSDGIAGENLKQVSLDDLEEIIEKQKSGNENISKDDVLAWDVEYEA